MDKKYFNYVAESDEKGQLVVAFQYDNLTMAELFYLYLELGREIDDSLQKEFTKPKAKK